MSQVQIELPDDIVEAIHDAATDRGTTDSQVVTEAVTAFLAPRRRLSFAGMGASGHSDTASRCEEILRAKFAK